ncbi:MAG: hypothetical protein ACYTBS_20640, partial [Planctomycetota bacterium]
MVWTRAASPEGALTAGGSTNVNSTIWPDPGSAVFTATVSFPSPPPEPKMISCRTIRNPDRSVEPEPASP